MAQQQRSRLLYQPQQRTMVEKFLSNNEDGRGDGENGSLMREGCGGAGDDQGMWKFCFAFFFAFFIVLRSGTDIFLSGMDSSLYSFLTKVDL